MKKLLILILLTSGLLLGQSAFDSDSWNIESDETGTSPFEWAGFYEFEPRFFQDNPAAGYQLLHSLDVTLNVVHDKTALKATVNLDDRNDTEFIEEMVASVYLGRLQIDAGRQRLVWGKGDQIHLVDNLNADDYYDFIFPDYLQRRRAEDMLHLTMVIGPYHWNSQFELAYAPSFTPFQFPETGAWKPGYLDILGTITPTLATNEISISEQKFDALDDGQYAIRWTQSIGSVDYGLSYYNGKLRIPAFTMTDYNAFDIPETFNIIYNPLQVYGVEFATAIRSLNVRSELAYFKTDDPDGQHYDILNPKWSVLLGGDINLPIHNLSLHLQYLRDFVTDEDPVYEAQYTAQMQTLITNLGIDPSLADLDLTSYYENHLISARIGDSYFRETLKPEIQYVYRLDNKDSMMAFLIDYEISEGFHAIGIYRLFSGDPETVFGQYDDNDFISLRFEYIF